MYRPLALDDFDTAASGGDLGMPAGAEPGIDIEEERLASYDKGYAAGWEDATAAHTQEQSHITAEFSGNLRTLSFTFQEAHAAFMSDVGGLLQGIVDTVVPEALRPILAETILERATQAAANSNTVVHVVVAPENVARMEALCADRPALPLRISSEASLGQGQAFLRFGTGEESIDVDDVLAEMRAALRRAFEPETAATSGASHPSADAAA